MGSPDAVAARSLAPFLALALALPCLGETIPVGPPEEPLDTSLRKAIEAAADGDTVLVGPGVYRISEALDFNALHDPADPSSPPVKDIAVRSSHGPAETTITLLYEPTDPGPTAPLTRYSIFIFESGETRASVLEGFTITGGMGANHFTEWHSYETYGAGIFCVDASPTIANCVISGNGSVPEAEEWVISGGGLFCRRGSPLISGCSIIGNRASVGGGVYALDGSPTLVNCLVAGNVADHPCCTMSTCSPCSLGGGVYIQTSAVDNAAAIANCTITENLAGRWSGMTIYGEAVISNSILWGNLGLQDVEEDHVDLGLGEGAEVSVTASLIGGPVVPPGPGNIGGDPLFLRAGTWTDVGWPVWWTTTPWKEWAAGDYRLRPGSPCIDAGAGGGAPATDLDGKARPCGLGPDMGAYETGTCLGFLRGDANADGGRDLSDPVRLLEHLFLGGDGPSCPDAGDADDTGVLDLTDAVYLLGYLFLGGPPPPEPFRGCSADPTPDGLDCASHPPCDA